MCVRIPPNTDGGPPAAAIPTPVRLQVRSENGRPLDPPPTADSCCCCSFVGSCRRRAPSGTKRKQPVRPPNKIKNIQIYGRARSSLFPQIYFRHSAPPKTKARHPSPGDPFTQEEKREDSSPTRSCCSLPHALDPPPPPLHPLTAVDSQQRTTRTPYPPHTSLPQVDQHAGSAGQKPHDNNNNLPLAHLPDQRPPCPRAQ